jgi:hypothetical protein
VADRYRRRVTETEAMQWLPGDTYAAGDLIGWISAAGGESQILSGLGENCVLGVRTMHGDLASAHPGDWVLPEPQPGFFYPVDKGVFAATYEPVEPNPNSGHGHVRPRPDGFRARCGGPGICGQCSREASQGPRT